MIKHTKTLKVRVRDRHTPLLNRMARSVNFVWNFVNELSQRSIKERGVFLSAYDMHPYTKGAGKELGLHSQTLQCIAGEYVTRRKQFTKVRLNWRKSGGVRRSLGWIPVNTGAAQWKNGQVYHNGHYFNVVVGMEVEPSKGQDRIGIDLGLTDTVTCSDGTKLEAGRFYRGLEEKLAIAQRARNKTQVKTIHAKIANRRKDALHKFSRKLVNRCGEIYVGNVSSLKLVKTTMAKSVLDAGWGQLKTMLDYKCAHAGIVFKEVDEAYTTQTCSSCGSLPESRPKGIAGFGIREWTCSGCGVTHDRDINAARNILAAGHGRLAVGIPVL
ncbi:transposase [Denitrificimonas sp. JX-1]|uniref:Transposase n=1 Tax=Denitrificimonas halotolerans TaxID=3098930 RepID=A0ABU5GNU7_9GAMM|nr:transposase [Denitrificimonas sp. JX-1]MDY7218380.1 transposase [Denitrificimonas sp. JX-1]